jgi:hypothetical protein
MRITPIVNRPALLRPGIQFERDTGELNVHSSMSAIAAPEVRALNVGRFAGEVAAYVPKCYDDAWHSYGSKRLTNFAT